MRRARETIPAYPKVLLVYPGDVAEGYRLLSKRWPEAHAVTDRENRFCAAFCRPRATWRRCFGVRVWRATWRALRNGHGVGRPLRNGFAMPGAMLVREETVVWSHEFEHVGDHPDWSALPGL